MANRFFLKKVAVLFLSSLFLSNLFCTEKAKWTIAAQKFTFENGQKNDSVNKSLSEEIPVAILEKINKNLERNVLPDESYSRESKKLLRERSSLFLQLSSAYKKRDSLFLQNISDSSLKYKIKQEEKNILEVQKKIDENLKKQSDLLQETEKRMEYLGGDEKHFREEKENTSEIQLLKSFFKDIFNKEKSLIQHEEIGFYQNNYAIFYEGSAEAKKSGVLSQAFANEIYAKNINCLITGEVSRFSDYLSVKVEAVLYPQAKIIGTVMEIGSLDDLDLIASNIATNLVPILTNSMPVKIAFKIEPEEVRKNTKVYIDDVFFNLSDEKFVLESGVHNIQFVCEGYKSASTNYFFEGNSNYLVEVFFEEKKDGELELALVKPVFGDIFANGIATQKLSNRKSKIQIDGKKILGEFISEDGENAFFYVSENQVKDGNFVSINPKAFDREKHVDVRRKIMYGSYTLLMISLIPTFASTGELQNAVQRYQSGLMSYEDALKVQTTANVFSGISIGCGVLFAFELVRYFLAANSVLPQKAKSVPPSKVERFDIPFEENEETVLKNENLDENGSLNESLGEAENLDEKEVENLHGNETENLDGKEVENLHGNETENL